MCNSHAVSAFVASPAELCSCGLRKTRCVKLTLLYEMVITTCMLLAPDMLGHACLPLLSSLGLLRHAFAAQLHALPEKALPSYNASTPLLLTHALAVHDLWLTVWFLLAFCTTCGICMFH